MTKNGISYCQTVLENGIIGSARDYRINRMLLQTSHLFNILQDDDAFTVQVNPAVFPNYTSTAMN